MEQTLSRAQRILYEVNEQIPVGLLAIPAGIGALSVGANITHQILQARRRKQEKIQQAGMGTQYDKAQATLKTLNHRNRLTLHLNPGLNRRVQAQKGRVREIENSGLHAYHSGLTRQPAEQMDQRRQEIQQQ